MRAMGKNLRLLPWAAFTLLWCSILTPVVGLGEEGMAQFPAFRLRAFGGQEIDQSFFTGRLTYVDFWASWCPPCVVALPWLDELSRTFPEDKFQVLGINMDEDQGSAEAFIRKFKLRFLHLRDPGGSLAEALRLPVMPSSFLVDGKGRIVFRHSGFRESDKQEILRAIELQLKSEESRQSLVKQRIDIEPLSKPS